MGAFQTFSLNPLNNPKQEVVSPFYKIRKQKFRKAKITYPKSHTYSKRKTEIRIQIFRFQNLFFPLNYFSHFPQEHPREKILRQPRSTKWSMTVKSVFKPDYLLDAPSITKYYILEITKRKYNQYSS